MISASRVSDSFFCIDCSVLVYCFSIYYSLIFGKDDIYSTGLRTLFEISGAGKKLDLKISFYYLL
jgi:hypothetical protein